MQVVNNTLIQAIEFQQQGKIDEASSLFSKVLAIDPGNAAALYSLSLIAHHSGNNAEALRISERGVNVAPLFSPLHLIHGAVLQAMGRKEEALQSYDKALEISPNYVEVLTNSGVLLRDMLRHREALERFNHILSFDSFNTSALSNCGILLTEFKQSELAIPMFKQLISINPDYDYALGLLAYEQLHICDWTDFEALSKQITEGLASGRRSCKSLAFMSFSDSAEDHQRAAKLFSEQYCPKRDISYWQGERYHHKKIRLAYVSPDLREHPVGHLMTGVFERHDKSRFELTAISLGIDDGSRLRARMLKTFDHFIDAQQMSASQIAQTLREMEIDIAVDLAGYTSDSRADIFAHRPVPVQVNYLGYPGTMGTEYMDYILADRHVIPENQQQFYSEKVVYLPDSYLPTDSGIQIAERTPSREECGLPATGVVFCSFSHDYKILPATFAIWMRLLQQVPGSVLWLMSRRDISIHNLCLAAEQQGIDPARLIFATRVPLVEDHLARYRLADIFLDTHPYNAHTTAADALMAGLPVVTYMGNAFPARVAGSLLQAIGMPELIAQSLEEYEQIALRLVTTPELLADVKARLVANKATCALFDTEGFTRNLEEAYMTMHGQDEFGDAGYQTQLDGIKQFQELSYETQTAHWLNDGITPDRLLIHQSWFREDTIDFWRHERMNEAVFKCLIHTQSDRWLTVGDGRYGLDAIRMVRRGFSDVTATDLTDHLLKISFDAGLLKKISAENAEKLSFSDSSFDFVLCKEAFHHFPRPMLALYEMLRVARKGVVFIEPLDQYIDIPILGGKHSAGYEADGNYVYTLSRREVEKAALGLNLPAVAFKNICDIFEPGLTSELALESNPDFISFRNKLIDIEARCEKMELQYNVLMAVIFITMPNESEIKFFTELGWSFEKLDRNPFVKQA